MFLDDECEGERRDDHHDRQRAHAAPVDGEFRRIVEQTDRGSDFSRSRAGCCLAVWFRAGRVGVDKAETSYLNPAARVYAP